MIRVDCYAADLRILPQIGFHHLYPSCRLQISFPCIKRSYQHLLHIFVERDVFRNIIKLRGNLKKDASDLRLSDARRSVW